MQPIVYNNLMKYLLFRGSSLQNAFLLGLLTLFSFTIIVYFSDSYTVKCMCDSFFFLFHVIWKESGQKITTMCWNTWRWREKGRTSWMSRRAVKRFFFLKTFEIVKLVVVVLAKAVCAWTPTSSVDSLRGAGLRSSPENQIPLRTASC